MAQTPRKFSEKIAILERKSKVEADDFMSVMADVKKITSTGNSRSPQTTPSSTPYPCSPTGGPGSSSANQTPSATESPVGLMPDANNLHVMHSLAGTPWQRPGGSLPNVHQMVQQKLGMMQQMSPEQYQNWLYWQSMQAQTSGGVVTSQSDNHQRTRSPGSAAHYHPYRSSPNNVAPTAVHRNERIPLLESHMPNNVHLQPPDPSCNRARSDPAIHMNTMNSLYFNSQPNAQFNQQMQEQFQQQQQTNQINQQQYQQQQQWAAQMQNGMMIQQQQYYAANGSATQTCTTPTGSGVTPQTPNSQPGSAASSNSSVPISMSSPQHPHPSQQMQYNNGNSGYLKQSSCESPNMAVGSLPNMHSSTIINHHQQQQQFKADSSNRQQAYYDYDYDPQQQQQPLQSAPTTTQPYSNGRTVYAYSPQSKQTQAQPQQTQYRPQHQLTMPQGMGPDSSQSAPTSPAQSYTNNPLQPQWTPTRHYSASPDNISGIPRVTLTRVEGNTECFQEFQDLCLDVDNDLQQALIQGGEDHFDPVTETQLINSTR